MDWNDMAGMGKDEILAALNGQLRRVIAATGVPVPEDPSLLICCPFHGEKTGSFNVFIGDDSKERFYCHGCGVRGDVIDFVQKRLGLDYAGALEKCEEFAKRLEDLPAFAAPAVANPADLQAILDEAATNSTAEIEHWLFVRDSPVPAPWLVENFRVGVNSRGEIVIPHYGVGEQQPRAVKRRRGSEKAAYSGSRLTELYGVWRDRRSSRVVLCEGESDTWTVAYAMRNERVDVMGLPRGVGSAVEPTWLDVLKDRDVTILFDADNAGRAGMRRWADALQGLSPKTAVRFALLPEGTDASSAGSALESALRAAQPAPNFANLQVFRDNGKYLRRVSEDKSPIPFTSWALEVLERVEIVAEEGAIPGINYLVRLPDGRETVLPHKAMNSSQAFTSWAAGLGLANTATGTMTQGLYELIEAESKYVPRYRGTNNPGWHGASFVLPGLTLGEQGIKYIEGAGQWQAPSRLGTRINPEEAAEVFGALAQLQPPPVIGPMLGWMAAAIFRPFFDTFPFLAVMGEAGSGKTTVLEEATAVFGVNLGGMTTVANSTPFAVSQPLTFTNAIPTVLDEYRNNGKPDTLAAVDNALRAGFNGASVKRAGVGDDKTKIHNFPIVAPVILAGEGGLEETSLAERAVYVTISKKRQNRAALDRLRELDRDGVGLSFMSWCVTNKELVWELVGPPPNLSNRQEQSSAAAKWGYDVLRTWMDQVGMGDLLPDWDESLLEYNRTQLSGVSPYLMALREGMDVFGGTQNLVVEAGTDVIVQYTALHAHITRRTSIKLAGGHQAFLSWLHETYDVISDGRNSVRLIGAAGEI